MRKRAKKTCLLISGLLMLEAKGKKTEMIDRQIEIEIHFPPFLSERLPWSQSQPAEGLETTGAPRLAGFSRINLVDMATKTT